jgi:hypothetical protein
LAFLRLFLIDGDGTFVAELDASLKGLSGLEEILGIGVQHRAK